jgi:hypothetical protein
MVLVPSVSAQDPTPEPFVEPGTGPAEPPTLGRVIGLVQNKTPGAQAPSGISVWLYALENFEPVETFTGTVTTGGFFSFDNVPLVEGLTYITTLDYQNVAYGSTFYSYEGDVDEIELDIEAFEATSDSSVIVTGRMHIIVEFVGENIRVSELYVINNLSDRVYVGPSGDPNEGTIKLPVPSNALNTNVERGMGDSMVPTSNSVLVVDNGFLDTLPVRPGTSTQQLMVTYELPYPQEVSVTHQLFYPVASVSLFVPDAGLSIESDVLSSRGQQAMGGLMLVHWDAADLSADDVLAFRISGEPDMGGVLVESEMPGPVAPGTFNPHSVTQTTSAFFVSSGDNPTTWTIAVGGLAVTVALVVFLWRRQPSERRLLPREQLLQAIVDLDGAYRAGAISSSRYEWEREMLKSQLRTWYEI